MAKKNSICSVQLKQNKWLATLFEAILEYLPDDLHSKSERSTFLSVSEHALSVANHAYNFRLDFEEIHNLSYLYLQLGCGRKSMAKYDASLDLYDISLSILKSQSQQSPCSIAGVYSSMATVYTEFGQHEKAIEKQKEALALYESADNDLPDYTPELIKAYIASTKNNIGEAYTHYGDFKTGLVWYHDSLNDFESIKSDYLDNMATVYNNIGLNHLEQEEDEEALIFLQQAQEIREKILEKPHGDLAVTYCGIAGVYLRREQWDDALHWFTEDYEIRKEIFGDDHPEIALCYDNLAGVYYYLKEKEQSIYYAKEAISLFRKFYGDEHAELIHPCNTIAMTYSREGEYGSAEEWFEKARKIAVKINHPDNSITYSGIATLWFMQGDLGKSLVWYEKALEVYQRVYGIKNKGTQRTIQNICKVCLKLGDAEKHNTYANLLIE